MKKLTFLVRLLVFIVLGSFSSLNAEELIELPDIDIDEILKRSGETSVDALHELLKRDILNLLKESQEQERNDFLLMSLFILAKIENTLSDVDGEIWAYEKSIQVGERIHKSKLNPVSILVCRKLRFLYSERGDFKNEELMLLHDLKAYEAAHGERGVGLNVPHFSLAGFYFTHGFKDKGAYHAKKGYNIGKENRKESREDYGMSTMAYINYLFSIEDYSEIDSLISEATEIFSEDEVSLLMLKRSAAFRFRITGKLKEAKSVYSECLALAKKIYSETEYEWVVASFIYSLALVDEDLGNLEAALNGYREAMMKTPRSNSIWPIISTRLVRLLLLKDARDPEARSILIQSVKETQAGLNRILEFAPSGMLLQHHQSISDEIGHQIQLLTKTGDYGIIAKISLFFKGVVLDNLIKNRQVQGLVETRDGKILLNKLDSRKRVLYQMMLELAGGKTISKNRLSSAQSAVELAERELVKGGRSAKLSGASAQVSLGDIQKRIQPKSALVEFVQYSGYQGKSSWRPFLGALIVRSSGEPLWVDFGDIEKLRSSVGNFFKRIEEPGLVYIGPSLEDSSREQYRLLVDPLLENLVGVDEIIVAPDGIVNLVSFCSLVDPGGNFLSEKFNIKFVASGRDLALDIQPSDEGVWHGEKRALIVGSPNFKSRPQSISDVREEISGSGAGGSPLGLTRTSLSAMDFGPLPGAKVEAEEISKLLSENSWTCKLLLGDRATEGVVRVETETSPEIVHFATHGFFLKNVVSGPQAQEDQFGGLKVPVDPMLRGGLALAGASDTVNKWKMKMIPTLSQDGILFSGEIGTLDFSHTRLVVLSACSTGVGDVMPNEGILGLRRAVMLAGAKNLLMTLWETQDEESISILLDFYRKLIEGMDPSHSLLAAQRDALIRLREKTGSISLAIRIAGPFVMTSR